MAEQVVQVNRAPVLTLWAAIVAERLGYDREAALTMGKAVAGLNAQSKGRMLGIFGPPKVGTDGAQPPKVGLGEEFWVEICGRGVPAKKTDEGIRAVVKEKPIDPSSVERYLSSKFGEALSDVREAMEALAHSLDPVDLPGKAYGLYERFRPDIPPGQKGWGAKGDLDLNKVRGLANS
jgi:hypothetical protein